MTIAISKVGKLHRAGRKGSQRWRVKYWTADDSSPKTKYLAAAEGPNKLTEREATKLVSRWVQEVGATPGKAQKRLLPTLDEHIEHYFATAGKRCNPDVQAYIRISCAKLTKFFGSKGRISAFTPRDADRFVAALQDSGLADASIRSNLSNVKAVFRLAVKDYPDHFRQSPFDHIRVLAKPKKGTWQYVPYADVVKALNSCPRRARSSNLGWQVFISLCRFAGLRAFSEALKLEKGDVELTRDPPLLKVYGSKTARQSGSPSRVVPVLFPILKDLLIRAIGESSPADHYVVASAVPRRRGDAHRTLKAIQTRADLTDVDGRTLWRPGFQVLRACCEKDFLELGLSEYYYCRAIGHSPAVSRAYYLGKFEGATLDDEATDEFRAAARRVEELIPV